MAYNIDLKDGGKIILLYAKQFEWKDKEQAAMLDNQPIEGRVYRAFRPPNDSVYYLKLQVDPNNKDLPIMDGIRVSKLKYDTPEWSCEFVELNDENMLDFGIEPEDYEHIAEWSETNQKDFINLVYNKAGFDVAVSEDDIDDLHENEEQLTSLELPIITEDELKNKILDAFTSSLTPYTKELENNIKYLSMRDPYLIQALTFITNYLVNRNKQEDSSKLIQFGHEIAMSDEYGKGANMYSTLYHLDQYLNTNNGSKDLIAALNSIVLELIRIQAGKK